MNKTMLKKTSLYSAYNGLQCCVCSHAGPSSSSTSPSVLPVPRARPSISSSQNKKRKLSIPSHWRSYATVRDSSQGPDFRDNMNWPCRRTSSASAPSPYEIFELEKGQVYSKHKFYELVKIYHPDRHNPLHPTKSPNTLTQIERLERYRLVVQAHEILSDPAKRKAYDAYGAGWGANARNPTRYSHGYSSGADGRTYGTGPDNDSSPFANATWEDWERWYSRSSDSHHPHATPGSSRSPQSYAGTYVNPNAFASFVILFAVLSGIIQATRAGTYTGSIEEKAAAFTEETSRFLTERAGHYHENKMTSDGRIRHFLEKRDPNRYGLKDEEEDTYRKHFARLQSAGLMSPGDSVAKVEKEGRTRRGSRSSADEDVPRIRRTSAGEREESGDLVTLKRFDP